ncbi:MAG TPA: pantetheine-phosphate adenylyltransferase [Gammaproteobacteria bacterium]|nr:pantetheine-phosphate adenylyltransferase [Gammaproteobacteria bacterium]
MPITAIYPGTFDPVTNGHVDLVRRATRLFDRVVVAVAASAAKQPLFALDERIELAKTVLAEFERVEVQGFRTLMVDFAAEIGADVIVRGLRAVSDFEYEVQLAGMNRSMRPEIETVYLSPDLEYTFLSSTLIKDIARHGGDVSRFTHPAVSRALRKKFAK